MAKDVQVYSEIAILNCKFTKTQLAIDDNTSYKQWQQIGVGLKKLEGGIQFWIGDWIRFGERKYGETYKKALKETGYEYQSLADMKYVADKVSLRNENLEYHHHKAVAPLKAEDQKRWLDKAEKENLSVRELRQDIAKEQKPATPALPGGFYDVIYADPPWQYEFSETVSRSIENKYPTMSLDEICNLDIPVADNAVLLLWATAPKLEEALQVMNSWGFTYRTNAVWDKEIIGMGYWFRGQHELLLVGVKGNYSPPEPENRFVSVIRERRGEHSRKPMIVYEIIEKMFPAGKYLELFSRSERSNWTMWGHKTE